MSDLRPYTLSVVVPVYNESRGLVEFNKSLVDVLQKTDVDSYEVIYVDDGSDDKTADLVQEWNAKNKDIKLVALSRNFGKESALAAGIARASGQAVLMMDGDGQHPVDKIPEFVSAWQNDKAKVVVGLRTDNDSVGPFKRLASKFFHMLFNQLSDQKLISGSTDYRLIDSEVQQAYLSLNESDRITRGLIDWVGFKQSYVTFKANGRIHGAPTYGLSKLTGLAVNSFTTLTPKPLYMFGYIGVFITIFAFCLGVGIIIEQLLLSDPLHLKFTGTAMLGILLMFLVGIVLMSQGIMALYISRIHSQSKNRPLYVIDQSKSTLL